MEFESTAYFKAYQKRHANQLVYHTLDRACTSPQFGYGDVTYHDYSKQYSSQGWQGRWIKALPMAAWTLTIRTTYHLAKAILVGMPVALFSNGRTLRKEIYLIARSVEEALGWLFISCLFDQVGCFFVQRSQFNQTCYEAFHISRIELVIQFLKKNPSGYRQLPEKLRNSDKLLHQVQRKDPTSVQYASERLRNQVSFALPALRMGVPLRVFGERVKTDQRCILESLRKNPSNYDALSEETVGDLNFYEMLAREYPRLLLREHHRIRLSTFDKMPILVSALDEIPEKDLLSVIHSLDPKLFESPYIHTLIAKRYTQRLQDLPKELLLVKSFIESVMDKVEKEFPFFPDVVRDNISISACVVDRFPELYLCMGEEAMKSIDTAQHALESPQNDYFYPEELFNNFTFACHILKKKRLDLLHLLSEEVRLRFSVGIKSFNKDVRYYPLLCKDLKQDPKVYQRAMEFYGNFGSIPSNVLGNISTAYMILESPCKDEIRRCSDSILSEYPEFGIDVVKADPNLYQYLKGESRDNTAIGLIVVKSDPGYFRSLSETLRSEPEIAIWALMGLIEPKLKGMLMPCFLHTYLYELRGLPKQLTGKINRFFSFYSLRQFCEKNENEWVIDVDRILDQFMQFAH